MPRRKVEVFSLSFLDCICCGFGAVVLFYMVAAGQAGIKRIERNDTITAEVDRLEEEVLQGTLHLAALRNTLQKTTTDTSKAAARTNALLQEISTTREEAVRIGSTSMAQRDNIAKLRADVKSLEQGTRRLAGGATSAAPAGQQVRAFRGTGNRKYITGIKLKGKRILVLIDRSASMMDADLVNIIKLRNQPEPAKRAAPKWRHTLEVADWIATQFPAGSSFQMYGFNTRVVPLIASSQDKWLDSADPKLLNQAIETLRGLTPEGGTSLFNVFAQIKKFTPLPDQVVLITDGLPTQGANPPTVRKYINAGARARLFDEAMRTLPSSVPVDVILLPMQGDLPAPHRFWTLARTTGGNFLMPANDWP
ncbi:MAG: VWA domain-containing protein [Steroidobacteraceae bacterium]